MKKYTLVLLIILQSCNFISKKIFKPEIGLIEISSIKDNALKIQFEVQSSKGADAYVKYWKFLNQEKTDSTVLYSPISRNNHQHSLMLVDLNLDSEYFYKVIVLKNSQKTVSKTYSFKTTTVLPWVPYYAANDSLDAVSFDGYLHFHSRQTPGYVFITNGDGELSSYQKNEQNFKVSKWTQKETFLGILSNDTLHFTNGKQIIEYDKFGKIIFEAETGKDGIEKSFHHEIDMDEDGNIVTLVYDERIVDLSSVGGSTDDVVRGDGILVLNHNKEVVWEWSVFDVVNPLESKNILKSKSDWLHANSLCKDKQGNYYISFRNISQVWKINGKTGHLMWKLGGNDGDFELPEQAIFCGQHDIRINENNELTLLDNGNLRFKPANKKYIAPSVAPNINSDAQSRLLTLSIDTSNNSVSIKDVVNFPKEYFTHSQGSAEYINDSLVVFCSTTTKRIIFTDEQGSLLGFMPLEYSTYRTQYIKELYDTSFVK